MTLGAERSRDGDSTSNKHWCVSVTSDAEASVASAEERSHAWPARNGKKEISTQWSKQLRRVITGEGYDDVVGLKVNA